jgi:hypothetical protein
MPAPHVNPPVMIVSPIRKSAVSNRVIVQSCRIVRLNCWTANEQDGPQLLTDGFNEALSSHVAAQVPLPGTRPKRKRPYQAGRSKHWVKVKNRTHPAMYRVMDALA